MFQFLICIILTNNFEKKLLFVLEKLLQKWEGNIDEKKPDAEL